MREASSAVALSVPRRKRLPGTLLGAAVFLGTTYPVGEGLLVPFAAWLSVTKPLRPPGVSTTQYALIWTFVVLAVVNFLCHVVSHGGSTLSALTVVLYPLTLVLGGALAESVALGRAYLLLSMLETVVGCVEFALGVTAPFPGQLGADLQSRDDVSGLENLYFMRVFGLSANSSTFAQAELIALILVFLHRHRLSAGWRIGTLLSVAAAFVVTFNRAAIIALAPLALFLTVREFRLQFGRLGATMAGLFIVGLPVYFLPVLIRAFLRGLDDFDVSALAGRDTIWEDFWEAIIRHPWVGNGSVKLLVEDVSGLVVHAHNSFLELVATHGLLVCAPLVIAIALGIRWKNLLPVCVLLVFSLFQYGIFWNFSLLDSVLWAVLITPGLVVDARMQPLSITSRRS